MKRIKSVEDSSNYLVVDLDMVYITFKIYLLAYLAKIEITWKSKILLGRIFCHGSLHQVGLVCTT